MEGLEEERGQSWTSEARYEPRGPDLDFGGPGPVFYKISSLTGSLPYFHSTMDIHTNHLSTNIN